MNQQDIELALDAFGKELGWTAEEAVLNKPIFCKAMTATLPASGLLPQWQPIETAPFDERILVFVESEKYAPYICNASFIITLTSFWVFYRENKRDWYTVHGNKIKDKLGYEPTYWMPLPPKPTTKSEV